MYTVSHTHTKIYGKEVSHTSLQWNYNSIIDF